ncbi:MAG: hypothetical protein K2X87_15835 [Gemmataceae bacterium]|nr:hypothetical protein [Gemmataceae bacterium]
MAGLPPAAVLDLWDAAADRHPLDRPLAVLAAAGYGPRRDLAALSVGERDRRLWAVRERTFGPDVEGLAGCPGCGERVLARFRVADVIVPADDPSGREFDLAGDGWAVRFRLPDSRDLAAVVAAGGPDPEADLLARCLLRAETEGREVGPEEVPAVVREAVGRRMADLDPQADVRLGLTCPACGRGWEAPFDVAGFLWAELAALARRLLREVDALARVYGWTESEILSLSPARRRAYLDLAGS